MYLSEKDVEFRPPSGTPISLPACRIFPTHKFHDQTTTSNYYSFDLTQVLARVRESYTRGGNQFESVSSSQHDYPLHSVLPVQAPTLQPSQ